MGTLNLFELSQQFSQAGPQWLREHTHQSPRLTPAPPPSACGYYNHQLHSSSSNIHAHVHSQTKGQRALELGSNAGGREV